jgi:cytochrome c biogenesis protein CcmG/thiol:disulfide interchange protein DsbE
MRKTLYLLPVLVFLVIAAYFAAGLQPGRDPHELPSALIDKPLPDFDLPALNDGPNVSNASLKGQVVVINFFASWCVPCKIEHPILMRLATKEKLPLIGIAYKDAVEDSRRELVKGGDPYQRIGVDRKGAAGFDFGVYGVPETYVVDKSGHIRKRFVGPLNADTVEKELLPLLRELNRS